MRTNLIACLLAATAVACASAPATQRVTMTSPSLPASAVRHVVVFRYKPDAGPEKIRQVTDALVALKEKIPGILAVEHGVNNSPENLNQGFTHVFQVTFTNAAARDTYLPHPAHKAFGALLGSLGILDAVFVVDYTPTP